MPPTGMSPKRVGSMFTISATIRSSRTQDGRILLDPLHGQILCINPMGSNVFELMASGYDEEHIIAEISRKFTASIEIVRRDVREFIETLQAQKIVHRSVVQGPPRQ
jgi:hypothetical protein